MERYILRINTNTNSDTKTNTTDSGLVILECIEPILKHRSQANAVNELGIDTFDHNTNINSNNYY